MQQRRCHEGPHARRLTPVWAGDGNNKRRLNVRVEPLAEKVGSNAGLTRHPQRRHNQGTTWTTTKTDFIRRRGDAPATRRTTSTPSDRRGRCCFSADHGRQSLLAAMRAAPCIEVTGPQAQAMNHGWQFSDENGFLFIEDGKTSGMLPVEVNTSKAHSSPATDPEIT